MIEDVLNYGVIYAITLIIVVSTIIYVAIELPYWVFG